jgi:hypothetical protein
VIGLHLWDDMSKVGAHVEPATPTLLGHRPRG